MRGESSPTPEVRHGAGSKEYFDRVASESKPVDGLSRGRREGPWQRIVKAKLPDDLDRLLEAEVSESDLD